MSSTAMDNAQKALQIVRGKTHQETIKIISQALRSLKPSDDERVKTLQVNLLRTRASAYVSTKEFSRAKEDVTQINKLKPRDYVALEILARLYEHGDRDKAKTCYQAAIKSFQKKKGPELDTKALDFVKHLEKRMAALNWVDPSQRLPAEILLTIFEFVDFSQRVKLMRVCKEWNQLLSSPVLWQHLDFGASSLPRRKSISIRSTLIRAIGRAKGTCKSLITPSMDVEDLLLVLAFVAKYNASEIQTLDLRPSTFNGSSAESMLLRLMQLSNLKKARIPYINSMCDVAVSKSIMLPSRLEELELYEAGPARRLIPIGFLPLGLAPITLNRLTVDHRVPGSTDPTTDFQMPKQEYPSLTDLQISGAQLRENQITDNHGAPYVWQPCLYTNLAALSLDNCVWDCGERNAQGKLFVFPQTLRHLSLQNVCFWCRGDVVNGLERVSGADLTKLKTVRMTDCSENAPVVNLLLGALCIPGESNDQTADSAQSLESLTLDLFSAHISEGVFLPTLHDVLDLRCGSLKQLDVGFVGMGKDFIKRLTRICPVLESLVLRQLNKVSSAAIGSLIRSLDRLRRLELVDCPSLADDVAELKAFGAKKGVTVIFTDKQSLNQGRSVRYGM